MPSWRGIDQILPHPSSPEIFEPWLRDAREYVHLAELLHGPIPRQAPFDYVWGDALEVLRGSDARIVNLETSVTADGEAWPDKGINYRMHPDNVSCLSAADIDVCVLANNHALDWGRAALAETLDVLHGKGPTAPVAAESSWSHVPHAMAKGRSSRRRR